MRLVALVIIVVTQYGCGTHMPIQQIRGVNGEEYVINRMDKGPFGYLGGVKAQAALEATEFCAAKDKVLMERYSLDKDRAVMVWPETTMYFTCEPSKKN